MKLNFLLAVLILPFLANAGKPENPKLPEEVEICIGPGEKHNGTVNDLGGGAKEYGCIEGPTCCAYFNTATNDFTLNLVTTIRPVNGVTSTDYSYSASVITISSVHTVLGDIDPCEDPQYEHLCFE